MAAATEAAATEVDTVVMNKSLRSSKFQVNHSAIHSKRLQYSLRSD